MPTSSRFGNQKFVRVDVGIAPYNLNTACFSKTRGRGETSPSFFSPFLLKLHKRLFFCFTNAKKFAILYVNKKYDKNRQGNAKTGRTV